jgi:hypothetical protein
MPIQPVAQTLQPLPRLTHKPMEGLRDLIDLQARQTDLRARQVELEDAQRKQREAAELQQVIAQTGDDWETADRLLAQRAPTLRPVYMQNVHRARQERFDAMKAETDAELAEAQVGLRSLNAAIADPDLYAILRPGLAAKIPELAEALPDPGDPQVLQKLKALQQYGLTAKEQIEREDKWNHAFAKGDFRYAGEVLAQAQAKGEDLNEAAAALQAAGMPKSMVQAMMADPSSWTMTAEERSQEGDRAARQRETERSNRADEGIAVRGQDLSAATQRRGQDIGAATSRRGQDIGEAVETILGPDGKPRIVRRSQAVGQAPAPGADGAGKLSAAAVEKIAGADTALGSAKTIGDTLSKYESKLGPLAGRLASGSLMLPGADQGFAEFAAEVATLKNAVIKATTGAAMSEPEAQRIMSQVPDLTNQPAVFKARLTSTIRNLETLKRRTLELSGGSVGPAEPAQAETGRIGPYTYRVKKP